LTPYKQELSELSQERLNKNPLRILDDKIDGIKDFVKQSPKISDYLSNESKNQFTQLLDLLKENKINFTIDETLVRGLDYYTNMVFEIEVNGVVVGGGGRYGKLVGEFGGDDVSCVGMAFGIERVIDVLEKQNIKFSINTPKSILFFPLKKEANPTIIKYMQYYRDNGVICMCNYGINKLAKAFNFAEKNNYEYVAIIGENELKDQTITIKNIKTTVQETINYQKFIK
jgi:histidyl-tRNA synthetase